MKNHREFTLPADVDDVAKTNKNRNEPGTGTDIPRTGTNFTLTGTSTGNEFFLRTSPKPKKSLRFRSLLCVRKSF